MIIKEIHIREFGGLRNYSVSLDDGINVIEGSNESGKSTLLAFIRFIFYGVRTKRGQQNATERDRALSWDNGVADGYMVISVPSGEFRLERRGIRSDNREGYLERHSIIDLSTGAAVHKDEQAGDVFLGVPENVFDSTCFVRQLGVGELDADGLGGAIENLIFAADESINTRRVLEKLQNTRRDLQVSRGSGGKIEELKFKRDDLRAKLRQAEADTDTVIALRTTVDKYSVLTRETRDKLNVADDRCHAYETLQILKRFNILHAGEKKVADLRAAEKKLRDEKGHDGWLPDRSYVSELDSLSRRLGTADGVVALGKANLNALLSSQPGDPTLAAHADDVEARGGADGIIEKYTFLTSRRKRLLAVGVILIVLGALTAAASLGLGFAGTFPWLTLSVSYGITVAGFIAAVIGIALIPASARAGSAADKYLSSIGIEPGDIRPLKRSAAESRIRAYADACLEAKGQFDDYNDTVGGIEATLTESIAEADRIREECRAALGRFGVSGADDEIAGLLLSTAEKASKCAEDHAVLLADIEKYSASVRSSADMLSGYDEASLRSHLNPDAIPVLEAANPTTLKQDRDWLASQLEAGRTKLQDAEKNLAVLEGKYESPARIAVRLEETERELSEAQRLYDAVVLAYRSISGAGESLRRRITPRLKERAGATLSRITGGKYSDFGVEDGFSVSLLTESGSMGVGSMSGGTKDVAYFSLRTALLELFFKNDVPPLMLDEVFAQLDNVRTASLLAFLLDYVSDPEVKTPRQCLIFTCHTREATALSASGEKFNFITLD